MKGKVGQGGAMFVMVYRVILVSMVAIGVLGIYSISYVHHIDVREAEAQIMSNKISKCLTNKGSLDLDSFIKKGNEELFTSCGYSKGEVERMFARAFILNRQGEEVATLSQGDSGKLWVKELFDRVEISGPEIIKKEPGYFKNENAYEVNVLKNGVSNYGKLTLEVLVNAEA